MRILAIETSVRQGEVALLMDEGLVVRQVVPAARRLTADLVPSIQTALSKAGWQPATIELVAVDIGPGSFMGTRIGLTAAKAFAYAVNCELVPVVSVDAVARGIPLQTGAHLSVGFDAARGEAFVGTFEATSDGWRRTSLEIQSVEDWLTSASDTTVLAGPLLQQLKKAGRLPSGLRLAPEEHWYPRAEHVGQLGLALFRSGLRTDYWVLEPLYLRPSAAEEKLARAQDENRSAPTC